MGERPGSWRTTPLPADWPAIRTRVKARDGHCTWIYTLPDGGRPLDAGAAEHPDRCHWRGSEVDHIGDSADHRDENQRYLCTWHHRRRTALQANAAKPPPPTNRRPREQHPGLL